MAFRDLLKLGLIVVVKYSMRCLINLIWTLLITIHVDNLTNERHLCYLSLFPVKHNCNIMLAFDSRSKLAQNISFYVIDSLLKISFTVIFFNACMDLTKTLMIFFRCDFITTDECLHRIFNRVVNRVKCPAIHIPFKIQCHLLSKGIYAFDIWGITCNEELVMRAIIYLWKDWMLKQNKNNFFCDR